MFRSNWRKALAVALAGGSLALGQAPTRMVPANPNADRILVLHEEGRPDRKCVIERSVPSADGVKSLQVRALDNGDVLTVPDPRANGRHVPGTPLVVTIAPAAKAPAPVETTTETSPAPHGLFRRTGMVAEDVKPATPIPTSVAKSPEGKSNQAQPVPLPNAKPMPLPVVSANPPAPTPAPPTRANDPLMQPELVKQRTLPRFTETPRSATPFSPITMPTKPAPEPVQVAKPASPPVMPALPTPPLTVARPNAPVALPVAPPSAPTRPPEVVAATPATPAPRPASVLVADVAPPPPTPATAPVVIVAPPPMPVPVAAQPMTTAPAPVQPAALTTPAPAAGSLTAVLSDALLPSERERAALALAKSDPKALATAKDALAKAAKDDPAASVRICCIHVLAHELHCTDSATRTLLATLAADPDERVRDEADKALRSLGY